MKAVNDKHNLTIITKLYYLSILVSIFNLKNFAKLRVRTSFYKICVSNGRFGEHSGRRGGASTAAQNGATIPEVQVLGNWKSSSCAQKYVEQTASQKEKISRLLYPSCEDGSAEQGPDVFANSAMLSPK